ncbi:TIR domain-containing protein [Candidatus Nitrospira bockiana]
MGLPRTFVGFSSTDIHYYRLMQAWKQNQRIDFNFTDCQLPDAVRSDDEAYVRRCLRERIDMAGTYAMLIGEDTKFQRKFVPWEAEVAIEKGCTLIGINLNGSRTIDDRCPTVLMNVGAIFVPFSPNIVAYALEHYKGNRNQDWYYKSEIYKQLGYDV